MKVGLSPLQGQASFEETLRECERAEAAGFDSIWLGEHHNNPVLYPAPLIGLAAVASRTHSIGLGTGVLLLPLYHPVMVAEEGAMVDMISGGPLDFGSGRRLRPGGIRRLWLFAQGARQQIGRGRFPAAPALDRGKRNSSWETLPRRQRHDRSTTGAAAETANLVWRLGRAGDTAGRAPRRRLVRGSLCQSRRDRSLRAPV